MYIPVSCTLFMTWFPIMYDNSPAIFKTAPTTYNALSDSVMVHATPFNPIYDFLLMNVPVIYDIFSNVYDPVSCIYRLLSNLEIHMA
jgi:hypothetical protein